MSKKKGGPSDTAGASETDEVAGQPEPSTEGPTATVEPQVATATLPPDLSALVDELVTKRLEGMTNQLETASARLEEFLEELKETAREEIRSEVRTALAEERRAMVAGMKVENISVPSDSPRIIRVRTRDGRVRHHRARRTFGSTWRELDTHDLTRNELEALTTDPVLEIESD